MNQPIESEWITRAAKALNEQGFLFQQKATEEIGLGFELRRHGWLLEASEYPVRSANEKQTRIDLVLSHIHQRGVHVAIECKRANPEFKAWLFFDNSPLGRRSSNRSCFLESARISRRPLTSFQDVGITIDSCEMEDRTAFNFYLEAKLDRSGKASSTDAIEQALGQLMLGHSGLMRKLWKMQDHFFCRSIPVILTTAQLFEAQFESKDVSLEQGFIQEKDLKLQELDFAPINYRAADDLSLAPVTEIFSHPGITTDLISRQTRTVFVVQAKSVVKFLNWAGHHLIEDRV